MFKKRILSLILSGVMCCQIGGFAQELTQTIRGSVTDGETRLPLISATVAVYHDSLLIAASTTDHRGVFRMDGIPVGRCRVVSSYIGYQQVQRKDVIVNSVKEVILPFEMEESPMEIDELYVRATGMKGEALNTQALTSSRAFSVEESERYAGSRGDPARMASNFAGVQGNDDSNNDLVIRGNSPLGVLWRLEGVNIPNPNHFGVSGTTGGPVTILNNRVLALSDFMTGAFPAEFGNSNAGVFDLNMRNGNNEKHEFSGQLGFLGTEVSAEGPLAREKRSSYMAAYRYSTMYIFQLMGIRIGTDAVPRYQDLSFKLNFPGKNSGNLSLFGIGGLSNIDILASEETDPAKNTVYGDQAMDEHFRTGMGVVGLNYSRPTGKDAYFKATISYSLEHQSNHLDKVYRHIDEGEFVVDDIKEPYIGYHSDQSKFSGAFSWNKKINSRHAIKTGLSMDVYYFNMDDSIFNEVSQDYVVRLDHRGPASLVQPYVQWKYKSAGAVTITGGIHGQLLNLESNNSRSLEPRLGMNYQLSKRSSVSFGMGLHSQMLPTYIYFAQLVDEQGAYVRPNTDLGFIRSFHSVLSWNSHFTENLRMKIETYYQHLYQAPVEQQSSSYSVLDEGHNMIRFFPDSLENMGTGRNYGLEITLEKFFSGSYFMMLTASLYDASRTGSDGVNYNAVYNGGYALNALGSKEFSWGVRRKSSFTIGGKLTLAGGKRYTPIDIEASELAGEAVYEDHLRNSMQFSPYFRADLKLTYRINAARASHEIGFDLVNVSNRQNVLKQTYISGGDPPVIEVYQLGILPLFVYRLSF